MAFRFIAIVHRGLDANGRPRSDTLRDIGLHAAVTEPGFELWINDASQCVASPSSRVHVVGRLFSRGAAPTRIRSLDPEIDRRNDLVADLCSRFWGQYIAFCRSPLGSIQIFRDPGGGLPCYFAETDAAIFLFSDIDVAAAAGIVIDDVNLTEVVRLLAWPALRPAGTALNNIRELPNGWQLAIAGSHYLALREVWSPWSFVKPNNLAFEEAAAFLRETVVGVVRALRAEFDRVHLSLSGGLDSSIIAAGLAPTGTTCLNLVAAGVEGDERSEATLVARHFGLDIVERPYRDEDADIAVSSAAHLPRPVGSVGRLAYDRVNLDFAVRARSQALFTGFGGDNVFCLTQSATPIADRLRHTWSPFAVWRTAMDVCEITGCDFATAFRRALGKLPAAAASYRWKREPRFLTREALQLASEPPPHPWLNAPPGNLAGRAAHIAMIMRTQNYVEGFSRSTSLEMVNPLLSQPIVELCLSIPSWTWIKGGRDRSLAREAFHGVLPAATISRRAKGGPGAFYRQLTARNAHRIAQILANGRLACEGLLDVPAIEAFFDGASDAAGLPYGRVLDLCDTEAWLVARSSL